MSRETRPAGDAAAVQQTLGAPRSRRNRLVFVGLGILFMGLLTFAVTALLTRFGGRDIPASAWSDFSPPGGRCHILMPGVPATQSVSPYAPGLLRGRKFTVKRDEGKVFLLAFFNYSDDGQPPQFDELYTATRKYILKQAKGELTSERDIEIDNHPGKEFQGQHSNGETVVARVYLLKGPAQHRLYVLLVGGVRVKAGEGATARFFDSFQMDAAGPEPGASTAAKPEAVKPAEGAAR
jgi:hypothetical protein